MENLQHKIIKCMKLLLKLENLQKFVKYYSLKLFRA